MSPSPRLLLIDDDRALCDLLDEYLRSAGFQVDAAYRADDGLKRALDGDYGIVVLDVMLPDSDGFEVLRRIRARSRVPVLMLTARGEEVDRIVGLEIGADDYLPKPFNPRELAARLRAILRRSPSDSSGVASQSQHAVLRVDDVELDPGAWAVRLGGRLVELTGTEFSVLEMLLRSAGRVVTREDLCTQVLGRRLQPFDRSIDIHVSHVRKKLGPSPTHGERIRGIRGSGYVYLTPGAGRAEGEPDTLPTTD